MLRKFVVDHPWSTHLQEHLTGWITPDGGLCEYSTPEIGRIEGRCFRDLASITPYLLLLGDRQALARLYDAAERQTADGLLVEGRRAASRDNHGYVLSFYLLYRLTGEEKWRSAFLQRCSVLRRLFFRDSFPPACAWPNGRSGAGRSASSYGLLELFCLAHQCDPSGEWLAVISDQVPHIAKILKRQSRRVMPRRALRLMGFTLFDRRPGALFARLFKDNSNLVYSLVSYHRISGDRLALHVLRQLIEAIDRTFLGRGDGWANTELWNALGYQRATTPLLLGNAFAIDLCHVVAASPEFGSALRTKKAGSFIDGPLSAIERGGTLALAPSTAAQHLGMIADFVTAAFLWLSAQGRQPAAETVLERGFAAVERHRTRGGLATLTGSKGPGDTVCTKYNFQVLKLLVCHYLLKHGPALSPADRSFIAEIFLIDR